MRCKFERYYDDYRPKMRTADLVEFASPALLGAAIRMFTKQPVNHSTILLDMCVHGNSTVRKYVYEADDNGFHPTWLSRYIRDYKGGIYWYPLADEYADDDLRIQIALSILRLEGTPYDYKSLFRNAIRRVPLSGGRLYCSEAVQLGVIQAGVDCPALLNRGDNGVYYGLRPGELHKTGVWDDPIRIN